ncbi:MAG TPA: pectin acetylesterase-family hydrolase [Tahibacter sp.]|uniref:pectin acetylesterase-family hydrolase n=1 Tax=Tahibacter sp. TaxID=2056211 RepID=UPI002C275196|nr:pectin acetylesterase-family hydrolase [Tahibacter sp.]HSX59588.1 pectin acetylesterase-family hydrolase [Tahibacter sp.]
MNATVVGFAALCLLAAVPGTGRADGNGGAAEPPPEPCTPGELDCWLTVKPAEIDGRWTDARCNDGTPAGYAFRPSPSGSNAWVILFEGGGSCDDLTLSCAQRGERLTTTSPVGNGEWTRATRGGVLNPRDDVNPDFHAANMVQLHYCSSDQWTGATSRRRITSATPQCTDEGGCGWYFSGRANAQAAIESLRRDHGLRDDGSQRVLFVGTSAGGFGLAANAQAMTTLLPATHAADGLRFVLDGAFALDGWNVPGHYIGNSEVTSADKVALQNWKFWRASFDTFCEGEIERHPSLCTFLSIDYAYLTSPTEGLGLKVLLQNSTLDSVAIARLKLEQPDDPAREAWRCAMTEALDAAPWLFSSGVSYHTLTATNRFNAGTDGNRYRDLLGEFWRDETPRRIVLGNPPCP